MRAPVLALRKSPTPMETRILLELHLAFDIEDADLPSRFRHRCPWIWLFPTSWSVVRALNFVFWGRRCLLDASCFSDEWIEYIPSRVSRSGRERKPETSSRFPAWTEWSLWARWKSPWCGLSSFSRGRCDVLFCPNDLRLRISSKMAFHPRHSQCQRPVHRCSFCF